MDTIDPKMYSQNSWVLMSEKGGIVLEGEGVKLFDSYDEASAERDKALIRGFSYWPVPLIK